MQEQEGKQIPLPAIIAGVVIVVGIAIFAFIQFLKPSGGGGAEAAAIANQIKASPNSPTVPRDEIAADVVTRGGPGGGSGKGAGMMGGGVAKNSGR